MEAVEVAEFIRESSRAGELLALADIEAEIAGQNIPVSGPATESGPEFPRSFRKPSSATMI